MELGKQIEFIFLFHRSSLYSSVVGLAVYLNCSGIVRAQLDEVGLDGSSKAEVTYSAKFEVSSTDAKNIKSLVDSKDIVELELKQIDYELLIRKNESLPPPPSGHITPAQSYTRPTVVELYKVGLPTPSSASTSAHSPAPTPSPSPPKTQTSKSSHPLLKSPMAGTFYRSPAPGQPPFMKPNLHKSHQKPFYKLACEKYLPANCREEKTRFGKQIQRFDSMASEAAIEVPAEVAAVEEVAEVTEKQPHKLERKWTFWYDSQSIPKQGAAWGSALRKAYSFDTVEEFWCLYDQIFRPSKLPLNADFHLFKAGTEPKWEDPECANGGKWIVISNTKANLDNMWLETLMALIGEQFDEADEICGVVASVRPRQDRLSLWTKTASNEAAQNSIGRKWKEILDVTDKISFSFHDDSRRDRSAKGRYTV
ncbi:mRNA cap-binding protein [Forsythia ovata]|uniref:Eukaryotic translation initiation factor isoform 4E n=1 Tax=Forsythia ovata TaxID=205694 RepID=A0ABD1PI15_9LAMI